MKKLNENEEFFFGGWIFQLSMNEGKVKLTPIRESSSKKVKKPTKNFTPPTRDEVRAFFMLHGYPESLAKTFFDGYENGNPPWHDSRGNPVISWKQKAIQVWFKGNEKEKTTKQTEFFQEEI